MRRSTSSPRATAASPLGISARATSVRASALLTSGWRRARWRRSADDSGSATASLTIADESSPQSWSPATKATRSYVIRVPSGDQRGSFPAAIRRMPPRTTSSVTTVAPPQSALYVVYEVRRCLPSGDHWSGPTVRAPAGASASQRCAAPSARTTQTPSRSPCSPTYAICLPSGENDGSAPEPTLRLWRLSSPAVTSCGGASSGHCAPTTMSPLVGAWTDR